jgi:uncharacterized protein
MPWVSYIISKLRPIGLDAMFDGKSSVVAGNVNRIAATMGKLLPRSFVARQIFKSAGERYR